MAHFGEENWKGTIAALKVRIVVKLIGGDECNHYFEQLKKFSTVKCCNLPTSNGSKSRFTKHMGPHSEIFLQFIKENDITADFTEFSTFQLYQSIHAVIGIANATNSNLLKDCKDFSVKYKDVYPVTRCYIFGGEKKSVDFSEIDYSYIPCEDADSFDSHTSILVDEITSAIVRSFETKLDSLASLTLIESPRGQDRRLSSDQPARIKARAPGRLAKVTGDLYLLSGAYTEAVNSLGVAVEETKQNSDLLWYAGAQEALQLALVLQSETNLIDRREAASILWITLPEKLRESAPLYLKADMAILAFEVYRTISCLLKFAGSESEAAMAVSQGWSVNRQLNFMDKLYVLTVLIKQYEELNMKRKRAFFLQSLSSLLSTNKESAMALKVLEKTFKTYGVEFDKQNKSIWGTLQQSTLRKAAKLSATTKTPNLIVQYHLTLLGYVPRMENEEQKRIFKLLKGKSHEHLSRTEPFVCLLPLIINVKINRDAPELWRRPLYPAKQETANEDTFIYNPFTLKKNNSGHNNNNELEGENEEEKEIAIAVNDLLMLSLTLRNPYEFPIDLVGLEVVGNGLASDRLLLTLPPRTSKKVVWLGVKPTIIGELRIDQIQVLIFGIPFIIKIPLISIAVIGEQTTLRILEQNKQTLSLIEGEEVDISFPLHNFGPTTATKLSMVIRDRFDTPKDPIEKANSILFPSKKKPLIITKGELTTLNCDETIDMKFKVTGRACWRGSTIVVTYSGSNSDYYRRIQFSVDATVRRGIRVRELIALSSQATAISKDENDYCLVAVDLHNSLNSSCIVEVITVKDNMNVVMTKCLIEAEKNKRLVFPMKRLDFGNDRKERGGYSLTGTQINLLGKEFISKFNVLDYQIKNAILDQMLLFKWSCFDGARHGVCDLTNVNIKNSKGLVHPDVRILIKTPTIQELNPLNQGLPIEITVDKMLGKGDYVLRVIPAIFLANDELDFDCKGILAYDGCLQVVQNQWPWTHHIILWAISSVRIKLFVHVEVLKDHVVHSIPYPLIMDFGEKKD